MSRQLILGDLEIGAGANAYMMVTNFNIVDRSKVHQTEVIFGAGSAGVLATTARQIALKFIISSDPQVKQGLKIKSKPVDSITEVHTYINEELKVPKIKFFASFSNVYGTYICTEVTCEYKKTDPANGDVLECEISMGLQENTEKDDDNFTKLLTPAPLMVLPDAQVFNLAGLQVKAAAVEGKSFSQLFKEGVTAANIAREKVSKAIISARDAVNDIKSLFQTIQATKEEIQQSIRDAENIYKTLVKMGEAIATGNVTSLNALIELMDSCTYNFNLSYNIVNRYTILNIL